MGTTVASDPRRESNSTVSPGTRVFVDTNILIYNFASSSPFHEVARVRIRELREFGVEFWISRQVVREMLAVATRQPTGELGDPSEWTARARDLQRVLYIAEEDAGVTKRLLELIEMPGAAGRQVHDANIVATMRGNGIEHILTHNESDFARYSEFVTILPLIADR